jgi:hypothetical protein
MKQLKKQTETLIQILDSTKISNSPNYSKIKSEIKEVLSDNNIEKQNKRNLLKITHTTRAIDTSLESFLYEHNILNGEYSLGQYLYKLRDHNNNDIDNITEAERSFYQKNIVDLRNSYMHSAGKICTNDTEVNELLNNMQGLLTRVAGLE